MNTKKVILAGVRFNTYSRGVNALSLGTITLLERSFTDLEYIAINASIKKSNETITVFIANKQIEVKSHYFSLSSKICAIPDLAIARILGIKPFLLISKIYMNCDFVCNTNLGDGFTDIYGLKKFIKCFTDSFLAILARKKLIILPQTIGPFNSRFSKTLGSYILKRADTVYTRDKESIPLLNSLGVKYELVKDMAVNLEVKKINYDIKKMTIGININGLLYFSNSEKKRKERYDYGNVMQEIIKYLVGNNWNILLIPHAYNISQPSEEDDLMAIYDIVKKTGIYDKYSIINRDFDCQELKYIISQTEFFIGARLHSCIAALSTSVPTIGIAYSYKFKGTFEMFGQEKCVFNLNDINLLGIENLKNSVAEILAVRNDLKERLKEINKKAELIIIDKKDC